MKPGQILISALTMSIIGWLSLAQAQPIPSSALVHTFNGYKFNVSDIAPIGLTLNETCQHHAGCFGHHRFFRSAWPFTGNCLAVGSNRQNEQ